LIKFLDAYKKEGVPIWGLTLANEPNSGYIPTYGFNSLGMNGTIQRDFVKHDIGPALALAGYGPDKLKLQIHDNTAVDLQQISDTVLSDADAGKFVSGVAFHWYQNGDNRQNAPLDYVANKFPGVFFLSTESCTLEPVQLGSWTRAERYMQDIINDLNHHTGGWIEWNMALDMKGGPNWLNSQQDSSMIVNADAKEYYKQPTFYALGHFAKFLDVDSTRLAHAQQGDDKNVMVTVFERPDMTRAAVILNKNANPVKVSIHDAAHGYLTVELKGHAFESVVWN
jgi:glucosylceramidase